MYLHQKNSDLYIIRGYIVTRKFPRDILNATHTYYTHTAIRRLLLLHNNSFDSKNNTFFIGPNQLDHGERSDNPRVGSRISRTAHEVYPDVFYGAHELGLSTFDRIHDLGSGMLITGKLEQDIFFTKRLQNKA